ncbi:hypothetical protein N9U04_01120, partial [Alphaproteobacteria bacterium]|nr:hypothetical protein [Alphaproteobacteria bacterium]
GQFRARYSRLLSSNGMGRATQGIFITSFLRDMSANSAPKHFLSPGLLFVIMAYHETYWG